MFMYKMSFMYKSTGAKNSIFDIITCGTSKISVFPAFNKKGNTTKTSGKEENQKAH